MLFRTLEPYYDMQNKQFSEKTHDECFICYQIMIDNNILPLQLNEQNFYTKMCNCIGSIHKECLERWVHSNNNCPVCRNRMTKKVIVTNKERLYEYIFLIKFLILPLFIIFFTIRKILIVILQENNL
jgi:hypothetical protein